MFLYLIKIDYLIFITRRFIFKYPLNWVNLLSVMEVRRLPLDRLLLWGANIWTCSCIAVEVVNVVRRFIYVDILYYRLTLLWCLLLVVNRWRNYPRGCFCLPFPRNTWTYPWNVEDVQFVLLLKVGRIPYGTIIEPIIIGSLLLKRLRFSHFLTLLFQRYPRLGYFVHFSLVLESRLSDIIKSFLASNCCHSKFLLGVTRIQALILIWLPPPFEMHRVLRHILLSLEFTFLGELLFSHFKGGHRVAPIT